MARFPQHPILFMGANDFSQGEIGYGVSHVIGHATQTRHEKRFAARHEKRELP